MADMSPLQVGARVGARLATRVAARLETGTQPGTLQPLAVPVIASVTSLVSGPAATASARQAQSALGHLANDRPHPRGQRLLHRPARLRPHPSGDRLAPLVVSGPVQPSRCLRSPAAGPGSSRRTRDLDRRPVL